MTPSPAERENGRALRLLVLGGTSEASALARAVAGRPDIAPLLSFAGRTEAPVPPPIPYRVGGFGGAAGLIAFIREQAIDAVVDATHPFAARISASVAAASAETGVPLAVFTRPPWQPTSGDRWMTVPDIAAAVAALHAPGKDEPPTPIILSRPRSGRVEGRTADPTAAEDLDDAMRPSPRALRSRPWMLGEETPLAVFLTTGRLDLAQFRAAPAHRYFIRTIDPPDTADLPPRSTVVQARPPFAVADEIALMRSHRIDLLVTKNSGGAASAAKLVASRELGLPVLMVERPAASGALTLHDLQAVLAWIEGSVRP